MKIFVAFIFGLIVANAQAADVIVNTEINLKCTYDLSPADNRAIASPYVLRTWGQTHQYTLVKPGAMELGRDWFVNLSVTNSDANKIFLAAQGITASVNHEFTSGTVVTSSSRLICKRMGL